MTGTGRRLSLQTTLVLCFVLVAILGIGSVSAVRYVWVTQDLLREQVEEDRALANAVVAGLERYVTARVQLVNTLAEEIAARGLQDLPSLSRYIEAANRRDRAFVTLLVTDREGVARVFSPAFDEQGRPNVGRRYDDRLWFQRTVTPPHSPSYEVLVGRAINRPTVAVAAPIRSRTGEVIGVVGGALNLDELRESVRDPARADWLTVLDARGRVIVHASREWEVEARDLSAHEVFRAAQRLGEGTVEYLSTFTGTRRWAAYVRMPSTGWVIWASRGPEFVAPRLRSLVRDTVLLGVAGILLVTAGGVGLSAALSRPLRALVGATRRVAARQFADVHLLSARSSRIIEFETLLRAFQEMAETLGPLYEDLESKVTERTRALAKREREARTTTALLRVQEEIQRGYGELAALLNSLDRSHILEHATKKVAASLHAPLAAVYLTDDGPARLRLKTYTAVDAAGLDTALLAPAGLPAEVARRAEPVILAPAQGAAPLRLQTGLGVVEAATVAGWPLLDQSRVMGVVVVATLEPLGEQARSFLDNVARQLSVALSNAARYESVRYQSQETDRLNVELRRASTIKSRFLASMSHELRTPLNSIIGFTDLLLASTRDPLTERQRTALETVQESGQHLLALINDVLDLSKIEAGRVAMRPEPFPMRALVEECLATIEPQAQGKKLSLRTIGLETVSEVFQDRSRVKQILLNLLSNAVKFTPAAGSVEVRVAPERDGMVVVAVADTGIGIPPEHLEEVFDAFRQLDAAQALGAGGTGLGLAISRRLARLAGGTLEVESVSGQGSVFTLRLPVRYAVQPPPEEPGLEPDAKDGVAAGQGRVLVIDDDRNAVELVRAALAGEPLRVEWAASPAGGLTRVRARRPALILLDVMLQGEEDGWDVLDALKRDPQTRDIPVVIHSVIDNPHRAEQLGADGVLLKPAEPATLTRLVRTLLPRATNGPGRENGEPG